MRYSLLGNWMLSHPTTNAMWYDKLSTSSDNDSLFKNLNLATDGYSDVECLVLRKRTNPSTKLSLAGLKAMSSLLGSILGSSSDLLA